MSRRRFARAYLFVFALLVIPGAFVFLPGAHAAAPRSLRVVSGEIASGKPLYEEHCASCHGDQARGSAIAPPLIGLGPASYDFMMSTGRMPLDFPTQTAVRRTPVLSRDEITAITAYLTSLAPGSGVQIPNVLAFKGNLSAGEQLYESNCAPCHGTTGNGGAVGPRSAPNLHRSTPRQIAEATRIGPTTMPRFGPDQLPYREILSLVRYVEYLRDPVDRGGWGLNHVGPLIEGFVAILVGLGLIVVLTRFLGTRS